MLGVALMLFMFSVTLQLPGNSAWNNNEIIGRSRRQDFTNLNPFNSNWFKRAICASGKCKKLVIKFNEINDIILNV